MITVFDEMQRIADFAPDVLVQEGGYPPENPGANLTSLLTGLVA